MGTVDPTAILAKKIEEWLLGSGLMPTLSENLGLYLAAKMNPKLEIHEEDYVIRYYEGGEEPVFRGEVVIRVPLGKITRHWELG